MLVLCEVGLWRNEAEETVCVCALEVCVTMHGSNLQCRQDVTLWLTLPFLEMPCYSAP